MFGRRGTGGSQIAWISSILVLNTRWSWYVQYLIFNANNIRFEPRLNKSNRFFVHTGGVAILSKQMPYNVVSNLNDEEMDDEGRIMTAEYSKFYLVCVYVPNAGKKLVNLDRRLRWNKLFEAHVTALKAKKPVIICGDMNVAHDEIGEWKILFFLFIKMF